MLDGKVITITGAGSGIGQAAARLFAEAGGMIVAGDVNGDGLEETASIVREVGGSIEIVLVDVRDDTQVRAMVERATNSFGRLDGAFNNAGVQMSNKLVEELTLEDWERVMDVNASGVFHCMRHQIPAMRRTGGGAIVNTSSANGLVAQAYASEYIASKHAVVGLTRGASTETSITGVRVNAVLPGMIETPMIASLIKSEEFKPHYEAALARHTVGRFGTADDVANVARFLLSNQSSFVNGAASPSTEATRRAKVH